MIVSINENNTSLYSALFAKAYQALQDAGRLREEYAKPGQTTFTSLDGYFAHMGDLLQIDPNYMLLPIDETPFEINANSRTITTPRLVTLQNDQIAETIVFTIDRYYDYKDLRDATTYVQWTLPDGTTGATKIELIDLETIPGKIRFGWPLDSEVTSQVGTVKYSVRFWVKEEGTGNVVYSLNTLTSQFNVSPSLQPEINDPEIDVNQPVTSFFTQAIKNSSIIGEGIAFPKPPMFMAPGLDLPKTASLVENALTLKAQAVVGDTGTIKYKWYHKPAGENAVTEILLSGVLESYEIANLGDLKTGAFLPSGKRYYVKDNNNEYVRYLSSRVPEAGTELYERFTFYNIPSSNQTGITGQYYVAATNTIEPNTTNPVNSTICTLASPDDIVYTKNLAAMGIMENVGSAEVPSYALTLNVETNSQPVGTEITHQWKKSTTSSSMVGAAADYGTEEHEVTAPGWYQVTTSVTLNREPKAADSDIIKVTFDPAAPALTYDENVNVSSSTGAAQIIADGEANLHVNVQGTFVPDKYTGFAEELFSERLEYMWYYQPVNAAGWQLLTVKDIEAGIITGGLGTEELIVNADLASDNTMVGFKCEVINHLNGKTASNSLVFYVA